MTIPLLWQKKSEWKQIGPEVSNWEEDMSMFMTLTCPLPLQPDICRLRSLQLIYSCTNLIQRQKITFYISLSKG